MALITPQTAELKLSKTLGIKNDVYFKREDLHPYGSHKGRSIPSMIDAYVKQGIKDFVISSSGNAALAAALYLKELYDKQPNNLLTLTVFVGEKIDKLKLALLSAIKNIHLTIQQVPNPKQSAFQLDKEGKAKLLRQSADDIALAGYEDLTKELAEIKDLSAVFIPTSSGTTAEGLYLGFKKLGLNPQIHIVQTEAVHPFVITNPKSKIQNLKSESLASAIVDKVGLRKNKVLEVIKNSHGGGWIATNTEIVQAIKLAKEATGIDISPNSSLSIVGLMQAIEAGCKWDGPVVCLITGA